MDKFEIGDKVNFVVERSLLSGMITKFYKNSYGKEECSIKTEVKTFPHILLQRVKKIKDEDDLISKITDLEAKLAESEKARKEAYQEGFLQKQFDKDMEIMQLKQQLAEKENTITNLIEDTNASKEFYKKQFNEQVWLCEELREKLAEKDQDKISFAVEQLEKVKELVDLEYGHINIIDTIDNQIKQLKEIK